MSPWDIAAGALIVEEAGGRVSDFAGDKLSVYKREIVASNGLIHQPMLDILSAGAAGAAGAGDQA